MDPFLFNTMNPNSSKQPQEYQDKGYQNPYYYPQNYSNYVINNQQYNQYLNYPMYYPPPPMNMKVWLFILILNLFFIKRASLFFF